MLLAGKPNIHSQAPSSLLTWSPQSSTGLQVAAGVPGNEMGVEVWWRLPEKLVLPNKENKRILSFSLISLLPALDKDVKSVTAVAILEATSMKTKVNVLKMME